MPRHAASDGPWHPTPHLTCACRSRGTDHPTTGELQLVVIKRKDTGAWALPGGMVDAGEAVSQTVKREFSEEAGALTDPEAKARFGVLIDELFGDGGELVYTGYVDDPRNTDNAWMETAAFHFHCSAEQQQRQVHHWSATDRHTRPLRPRPEGLGRAARRGRRPAPLRCTWRAAAWTCASASARNSPYLSV